LESVAASSALGFRLMAMDAPAPNVDALAAALAASFPDRERHD
jgi:hypothetical protein